MILPRVLGVTLLATALMIRSASSAGETSSSGWPTYGGSYANTRHAELGGIGPDNVTSLKLAWRFATGVYGQFETSPIVAGDTLYFTTGHGNAVYAIDARTGALRWRFAPKLGSTSIIMEANRGVAVSGGRVFVATLDGRLIALDARNGSPLWDVRVGEPRAGFSETMAPLAWRDLVFIGSSGGEYGIRGSFTAYSQSDGHLVWRWWTVSAGWEGDYVNTVNGHALHRDIARERAAAPRFRDAWRRGGGPIWMTPALDPSDATIYLSTGNPSPNYDGDGRPGDNLYTDSIVAIDARSGRMRWYYQETPHDLWDYDAASPPVLFDAVDRSGRRVPAVGEAAKTGWFFIIDRRSGKLIRIASFIPQTRLFVRPSRKGSDVQPGEGGGTIGPIAYDPALRAVFVAGTVVHELVRTQPGQRWTGGHEWEAGDQVWTGHGFGLLSRIDVDSGRTRWRYRASGPIVGGALSTGGLVFTGEEETGFFDAFDARSGKLLWQIKPTDTDAQLDSFGTKVAKLWARGTRFVSRIWRRETTVRQSDQDIHAPPIAYELNGTEYVVIAADRYDAAGDVAGDTLYAFTPSKPRAAVAR